MANLTGDFNITTREAYDKSFKSQVALALPLYAMLYEHQRVKFKGGRSTKIRVQKSTTESLGQSYFMNEGLDGGRQDVLAEAEFFTKYNQFPVQYDGRDVIENTGGELTAPLDSIRLVTETSQDGTRRFLQEKFWAAAVSNPENERDFNSVPQALTHDVKYGGLTRTIGSNINDWWQGASPAGTYTDQSTAVSPSLSNILKWATVCRRYLAAGMDGKGRLRNPLYMFVPEGIYQEINMQAEARTGLANPSLMKFKYGFEAINIYNIEIIQSSWMTLNSRTASMALLNPETWQLRIAPSRNFKLTPFKWQAENAGGIDAWLARILIAGTLTCNMPRANMLLLNVA